MAELTNDINSGSFSRKTVSVPPRRKIKAKASSILPKYSQFPRILDSAIGFSAD